MNPIDGNKVSEWLKSKGKVSCDFSPKDRLKMRFDQATWNGKFNLPPGTLIIQREEGYEKRRCEDCIAWDKEFHECRPGIIEQHYILMRCGDPNETFDDCQARDISKNTECKDCEYFIPCDKHVTFDELKNAIIVGEK